MRFLVDEMMSEVVSPAPNALAAGSEIDVQHILDLVEQGTQDDDIPALCREHEIETLITMNVKTSGRRSSTTPRCWTPGSM